MNKRIFNVLSLAGVDPSGGAGLLADLKAFSALGVYGCGVVTALTAQNTQGVSGIHAVPPDFVRQQLHTLWVDVQIDAVKIGMLGTAPMVCAVADGLAAVVSAGALPPVVLDPVMIAKSGDALTNEGAIDLLREALLPWVTVLTPNLPEAGVLLRERPPETVREMYRAAERLRRLLPDAGARWVLVKGGHLSADPVDVLHDGDQMLELAAPRIVTRHTHGTGCHLSAAIAAYMPQTDNVPAAVQAAKAWLTQAIRHADCLRVGQGHGPVHALHALWRAADAPIEHERRR